MTEQEINEVDGALWGLLYSSDDTIECETTVYKFSGDKIPVHKELGTHKYNIFTYKPTEPQTTLEFMKANIGDVRNFIDNYAKAGYNGLMVKEGCVPKKTIKKMIKVTCKNLHVSDSMLKPILAQV